MQKAKVSLAWVSQFENVLTLMRTAILNGALHFVNAPYELQSNLSKWLGFVPQPNLRWVSE
jgi:hypothetical protein